jgi:hypothetical protein
MHHFAPQNLANPAWAFSKLGLPDMPLLAAISSAARRRIGLFDPQNLSSTAWSFSGIALHDMPLMAAISAQARKTMPT